MAYVLRYMGNATVRQGDTRTEVFATLFCDEQGGVSEAERWGGSFKDAVGEGELHRGDAALARH
jgi:hypothetical protein